MPLLVCKAVVRLPLVCGQLAGGNSTAWRLHVAYCAVQTDRWHVQSPKGVQEETMRHSLHVPLALQQQQQRLSCERCVGVGVACKHHADLPAYSLVV